MLTKQLPVAFMLVFLVSPLTALQVVDDSGNNISLAVPAERIITLAPYLTELVFTAGAGDRLVATVSYSDFPGPAKYLPKLGDAQGVDIEAIMAMQPDLVFTWQSGNGPVIADKLSELGLTVFVSEPGSIDQIASTIIRIGKLAGTELVASKQGRLFSEDVNLLRSRYSTRKKIRVFYQFWNRPIYTVGGGHLITRLIELCGGENIFAGLDSLTPIVDMESVLRNNPAVIIASGDAGNRPQWLDEWKKWNTIQAVKNNDLYYIPPELIQRHTVRIVRGIAQMCEAIDVSRRKN